MRERAAKEQVMSDLSGRLRLPTLSRVYAKLDDAQHYYFSVYG